MYQLQFLLLAAIYGTSWAQLSNSSTPAPASNAASESYVLPMDDPAPMQRQQEVAGNQQGFLYSPSLLGNMSQFLTGPLADVLVDAELASFNQDAGIFEDIIKLEADEVVLALSKVRNPCFNFFLGL
jgi:hypothetical protein